MKKVALFLFLLPSIAYSQQERQLLLYNVGMGAVTSGIGAVINKPKKADWKKHFLKGFWQGSIGGLLNYTGKKSVYLVNKKENIVNAWPSKILTSAGTSIMENAALNEPFFQNWNFDYGIFRIDFSINNKRKFKIRLTPQSLFAIYSSIEDDSQFDLKSSLITGNLIFKANNEWIVLNNTLNIGLAHGRSFTYVDNGLKYETMAHELVHLYQYREYLIFNTWIQPALTKMEQNKVLKDFLKYVYPDIPYYFGFYHLQGRHTGFNAYKNFYEFEAARMATNRYIFR